MLWDLYIRGYSLLELPTAAKITVTSTIHVETVALLSSSNAKWANK